MCELRCTIRQVRGDSGREDNKVLEHGDERLIDTRSLDRVDRGPLDSVEGTGEFQWPPRERALRLFLGVGSQFQGNRRDVSKDLLLKGECFSDRT